MPPQRLFPIVRYLRLANVLKITKTSIKFKLIDSSQKCDFIKEKSTLVFLLMHNPVSMFRAVSSFSRSALLFGRFCSGLTSQLLSSYGILDYGQLNYVSLGSVSCAFFISLFLPSVGSSIYFNHSSSHGPTSQDSLVLKEQKGKSVARRLLEDVIKAYRNARVFRWSAWMAMATCGNFQIGNYIQSLWKAIQGKTFMTFPSGFQDF